MVTQKCLVCTRFKGPFTLSVCVCGSVCDVAGADAKMCVTHFPMMSQTQMQMLSVNSTLVTL